MDEYVEMTVTEEDGEPRWNHVLSLLDEALHKLSDRERDLVLQHYLEGRSYEEIAAETGRTKAACAKQSSRVLTKLCGILRRHGVTISATALGAGISAHYVRSVPAGFTQSLYQSALSASVSASPTQASTFTTIMTSTKFTTAAALISAGAALPLSFQWANVRLNSSSIGESLPRDAIEESRFLESATPSDLASSESKGTQVTKIDLQLLERELKKLPFPASEIRKQFDLERLMFQLGEDEVPSVVALIQRLDSDHLGSITEALFARWAEFDPRAAADTAEEMQSKYSAREGVMVTWAAADLVAALQYMETHPNGLKESSMIWATIGGLVAKDPEHTLALVGESITNEDVSTNITKIVMQAWGEADPDAALAWASNLEDELLHRSCSKAIVSRLAGHDPSKAFQLSLESLHPANRVGSARWTLMQWMGQDAEAASKAYLEMPAEFFRDEQMRRSAVHFAGSLAKRDVDQALALAEQIPDEQSKRQWLYGAAWEIATDDPAKAASVAEALPPSGSRKRALEYIGKQWLSVDAEAATQWIDENVLFDTKVKRKLLNQ